MQKSVPEVPLYAITRVHGRIRVCCIVWIACSGGTKNDTGAFFRCVNGLRPYTGPLIPIMNEPAYTLAVLLEQHARILWILGLLSAVLLIGTALLVPLIIVVLPADLFIRREPPWWKGRDHSLAAIALAIVRNLIGALLLFAGVVMLFVPGQGLLTILLALVVMDFPGKRVLISRLARNARVMRGANRIRCWAGKPAFLSPDSLSAGDR